VAEPPTVDEALRYLRTASHGKLDDALVEVFVKEAAGVVEFIEEHSQVRFSVAEGFPDYKPEFPGGRPQGGRSFNPAPFDFAQLGEWAARVTAFPRDWSDVGFDAETRKRMWGDTLGDDQLGEDADIRVTGAALVGGLLRGLLDRGVVPQPRHRAVKLLIEDGGVTGVVLETPEGRTEVAARRGVILAAGGFEWDRDLVKAFLRGPMNGPMSPPHNTGDGLRMAMKAGAALGNMGEAWWSMVVKLPGDVFEGRVRSRSVRLERARPRSIMVNRSGRRFANEAADYNSLGGAFHHLDATTFEYSNIPAWIVFDHRHLEAYGALGIDAGDAIPEWFHRSGDLAELAGRLEIDAARLAATVSEWNRNVAAGHDPDFGRGTSAYDGWWGDRSAPTLAGTTLGPIDVSPFYGVRIDVGCTGTRGGPRTDDHGQVLHVDGRPIRGLYAAGNAMASPTGMTYGGAGGTIAPALVFGHRAAAHAVEAHREALV
jgi:succinate dehydrogenase/fumarate reductase flavoprotein subunit